jgi:hypothetical protein
MTESAKRVLWRERVLAFEHSGLQRSVWCARHSFKVATLDYWRQQLASEGGTIEQRLIPIRVNAAAVSVGELKIEIGGGICLHAGANVDAAWLAALLRGLR